MLDVLTWADDVVPTCVGVNRTLEFGSLDRESGPHVCGGEPFQDQGKALENVWSPRVWG